MTEPAAWELGCNTLTRYLVCGLARRNAERASDVAGGRHFIHEEQGEKVGT
jgi:hypothetical protein